MTTNPITPDQPRETDGKFGAKHLAEAPPLELVPTEDPSVARAREVAGQLGAMLGDTDYRTPSQQIEERWSRNPHANGITPVPLEPKVIALDADTAQCPMCSGSGKTWASTEVECYLCEGQPGIPINVADGFVKDVKKTIGTRPSSSEFDFEGYRDDQEELRGAGAVQAAEWGGMDVSS